MKTILASAIALVVMTQSAWCGFTIWSERVMENGNTTTDGATPERPLFNVIRQSGTPLIYSSTYCSGPGTMVCPDEIVIPERGSDEHTTVEQAGMDYAQNQIRLGNLTGNTLFSIPGSDLIKRLRWSMSYTNDLANGFIRIWEHDKPEPAILR
jgi:hypothetical protein